MILSATRLGRSMNKEGNFLQMSKTDKKTKK